MAELAPVEIFDGFNRTDVDGWGVANPNLPWKNPDGTNSSDSHLDASSGLGTITVTSGESSTYFDTVRFNVSDTDVCGVLTKFKMSSSTKQGPVLRHTGGGNVGHRLSFRMCDRYEAAGAKSIPGRGGIGC